MLGVAILICSSLFAPSAQATYVATLAPQGSNVVATGSGNLNLASLTILPGIFATQASIEPDIGLLFLGQAANISIDSYTGVTGPASFGGGNIDFSGNGGSGGIVGVDETGLGMRVVTVPAGYVSGSPLTESSTWINQTLGGLAVTPGTYVWSWGSGASADSFKLNVVVPEPSSLLLFGGALAALLLGRMRRRIQLHAAPPAA
jgi:hypothetical protein